MSQDEKKLRQIFRDLPETQRQSLLDYAEFLLARIVPANEPLPEPAILPAKPNESVIGAIKRLSASYPMLDKSKMLNETSMLVTQHVMQGRDKNEVIEELEIIFRRHYEKLSQGKDNES